MIERGRDELVSLWVQQWLRRIAGQGEGTQPLRKKDDIFPGRVFDPPLPVGATPPVAPPPPPPNQHGPPGVNSGGYKTFFEQHVINSAGDAAIAAAVDESMSANQVYEHDYDNLQPVFAFGDNTDFIAVRGVATIVSSSATAVTAEALEPNLAQLYLRSDRYTDVRVASTRNVGSVGLWIGASYSGSSITGYLGQYTAASNRLFIYRVDANVKVLLVQSAAVAGAAKVSFQRFGNLLTLSTGNRTISTPDPSDPMLGAGYVGFGAYDNALNDVYDGFEVTAPL